MTAHSPPCTPFSSADCTSQAYRWCISCRRNIERPSCTFDRCPRIDILDIVGSDPLPGTLLGVKTIHHSSQMSEVNMRHTWLKVLLCPLLQPLRLLPFLLLVHFPPFFHQKPTLRVHHLRQVILKVIPELRVSGQWLFLLCASTGSGRRVRGGGGDAQRAFAMFVHSVGCGSFGVALSV